MGREFLEVFHEYITDPQKQKKSSLYLEFLECKKRYDLISNREDPEQNDLISSRFEIYNSKIPISPVTTEIFSFLGSLPFNASPIQRRQVFQQALILKSKSQEMPCPDTSLRQITSEILEIDPPPLESLNTQEKLILLRAMPKYLGDWEKILREYKDKPISVELLKKIWRCIKVTMKEEVADIRKKTPQYHYFK